MSKGALPILVASPLETTTAIGWRTGCAIRTVLCLFFFSWHLSDFPDEPRAPEKCDVLGRSATPHHQLSK